VGTVEGAVDFEVDGVFVSLLLGSSSNQFLFLTMKTITNVWNE